MTEFQAKFQAYGGDYSTTMERFMGNEEFYLRMLEMFSSDDSLDKLEHALHSSDLTAAFEAAHTLKGLSGNLGLTPLYNAVCDIVEPLRAGETRDYTAMCAAIRTEFQRACALNSPVAV